MIKVHKHLIALVAATLMTLPIIAQESHHIGIVAHRGYWKCDEACHAQNSIASLRLAQENCFWGSEIDAHLTSDNVIIVNHDNSIQGVDIHTNPFSAFAQMRLKNGEGIPTLDQMLDQAEKCPTTMLVLEFKEEGSPERDRLLVDMCLDALKKHNLYSPQRVMFISFSLEACKRVAEVAPDFANQYLDGDLSPDELKAFGINGLDYHHSVFVKHPEWITRAHELGQSVNVWTIDSEEDIAKFIELGVDFITTNEPLTARHLLGNAECREHSSCCRETHCGL